MDSPDAYSEMKFPIPSILIRGVARSESPESPTGANSESPSLSRFERPSLAFSHHDTRTPAIDPIAANRYIRISEYENQDYPTQTKTIFRALSDRTRLRILNLLQDGELCVCHIVGVLDSPQPTVSRHLAYLRKAGLVVARKEGLWMHYRLAPTHSKSHAMLLECLAQCFREEDVFAKDNERLRGRIGSACPE